GTHGIQLWRTDGTAAGTRMVSGALPGGDGPRNLAAAGGRLFFSVWDPATGYGLWQSDGTAAGTHFGHQPFPDTPFWVGGASPGGGLWPFGWPSWQFVPSGGAVFFFSADAAGQSGLWRSNGTGAGTTMVENFGPSEAGQAPWNFTAAGKTLYF